MTSELKVIPISKELKYLILAHKGLKGFATIGDALEDLLIESPTYRELIRKVSNFFNEKVGTTKLETSSGTINITKKDVESEESKVIDDKIEKVSPEPLIEPKNNSLNTNTDKKEVAFEDDT